jgi:hypothetical protein
MTITFAFDPNPYPYKFNDFTDFDQFNKDTRNPLQYYLYSCGLNCDANILNKIPVPDRNV